MDATSSNRCRGFTLTEVLVALLVLSIGLLGIGKLVLFSARSNDSAYMRSQATALASTILDDMRANRQTALNGGYNMGAINAMADPGFLCTLASTCQTGTQLALYDLYKWGQRLRLALGPSYNASVVTATVTNPASGVTNYTATITVTWDDSVAGRTFDGTAAGATKTAQVVLETVL